MLPTVCFEAGRFAQTQSSWTVLPHCSRKWMPGHGAGLALPRDRRPLETTTPTTTLRETLPLSTGGASSFLDFYLSWMSVQFHDILYKVFRDIRYTPVRDLRAARELYGPERGLGWDGRQRTWSSSGRSLW